MNEHNNHIDDLDDFFDQVKVPFEKSKEEVWGQLEQRIDASPLEPTRSKVIPFPRWRMAVAAAAVFVLGITFYAWFYAIEIIAPQGQHMAHTLPDGSTVELNAATSLSYNPYRWWMSRKVNMSGEAFFTVQKGSTFSVVSDGGITEVLGTSFNVYSRNSTYKVFCETGRVKVTGAASDTTLVITPGELVLFGALGNPTVQNVMNAELILGWKENTFNFVSDPLILVVKELERQYDVTISLKLSNDPHLMFTGFFTKNRTIESSLSVLCKSLGLTYEKRGSRHYVLRN